MSRDDDYYLRHRDDREPVVLDIDRRGGDRAGRLASTMDATTAAQRMTERQGMAELDVMLEQMPGLSRRARDRDRITARAGDGPTGPAARQRELADPDALRLPLSGARRRRMTSRRLSAQRAMSDAEYRILTGILDVAHNESGKVDFLSINETLSEHAGDVDALSSRQRAEVKRLDRAIRRYEDLNDHSHVVYSNVVMPGGVGSLLDRTQGYLKPGDVAALDRYSVGSHQMHEERGFLHDQDRSRTVTLEIHTRRGAYLGQGASKDHTDHLLPRSMQLRVVGVAQTTCVDREGRRERVVVVQAEDITPEPSRREA